MSTVIATSGTGDAAKVDHHYCKTGPTTLQSTTLKWPTTVVASETHDVARADHCYKTGHAMLEGPTTTL